MSEKFNQQGVKGFVFQGQITAVQPLATCSKDLLDREGGGEKPIPIPSCSTGKGMRLYFPGTGIRGTMRRAVLAAIREEVTMKTGNATPFSLDEHYLGVLGGIKGDGGMERSSVAHLADWREKNPLLSMFGAGDAGFLGFVRGNLDVGNAICVNAGPQSASTFSGARTDEFYRNTEQVKFLSEDDVATLVRRAKGGKGASELKAQIKKAEGELKKAQKLNDGSALTIQENIKSLTKELELLKEESGTSDNSIGRPLAGYKAIPIGEEMTHRIKLLQSNDIELGCLLAGLNHFSLTSCSIGAHASVGCGEIAATWTVYELTPNGKKEIGRVSLGDFEPLVIEGEKLVAAMGEFKSFMQSDLPNFVIPTLE